VSDDARVDEPFEICDESPRDITDNFAAIHAIHRRAGRTALWFYSFRSDSRRHCRRLERQYKLAWSSAKSFLTSSF
jgi:hypothetical protein